MGELQNMGEIFLIKYSWNKPEKPSELEVILFCKLSCFSEYGDALSLHPVSR